MCKYTSFVKIYSGVFFLVFFLLLLVFLFVLLLLYFSIFVYLILLFPKTLFNNYIKNKISPNTYTFLRTDYNSWGSFKACQNTQNAPLTINTGLDWLFALSKSIFDIVWKITHRRIKVIFIFNTCTLCRIVFFLA